MTVLELHLWLAGMLAFGLSPLFAGLACLIANGREG